MAKKCEEQRESFQINSELLNPKFELFKLKSSKPALVFPLSEAAQTSARPSNRQGFSFQKVQSVLRWNHISPLNEREVAYISHKRNVIAITVETGQSKTIFSVPTIEGEHHLEHCCLVSLDETTFCVSDGFNTIYIVHVDGNVIGRFKIGSTALLLHAAQKFDNYIEIVISNCGIDQVGPRFQATIARINSNDFTSTLLWTDFTADLPYFAQYDQTNCSWCLGSSVQFAKECATHKTDTLASPQYSWSQTDSELILTLNTQKFNEVDTRLVELTNNSIHIQTDKDTIIQKFWAPVDSSTSRKEWVEGQYNITFKKLDKTELRWPSIFQEDESVPEILTQSHLEAAKDSLSSITSENTKIEMESEEILSNLQGEFDEVDAVRNPLCLAYWNDSTNQLLSDQKPIEILSLLSLSMPIYKTISSATLPSIMIKEDVDGVVFERTQTNHWNHIKSFPAVAFTLASKRSVQYVHHTEDKVVALEGRNSDRKCYMYIYHAPDSQDSPTAVQEIVEIGDSSSGNVLGMVEVSLSNGIVVLCEHAMIFIQM